MNNTQCCTDIIHCFVAFTPLTLPAMPSVKPDQLRIALLKAPCYSVSDISMSPEILIYPKYVVRVHLWQEFYKERMSEEFRRSRFLELAQREGLSVSKTEKGLKEGKAPFSICRTRYKQWRWSKQMFN